MAKTETPKCRHTERRYAGQYAHPKGSAYGTVITHRCEACGHTFRTIERPYTGMKAAR